MNRLEKLIGFISPKWAMERAALRSYSASLQNGVANRLDRGWVSSSPTTVQTQFERTRLFNMRDRARTADADNPIAHGILNRLVDNVVGKGFTLRATSSNADFNREVEERFYWQSDTFDIRGLMSWPDLQRDAYRSYERDGDFGTALVNDRGLSRLQPVSSHQIETPDTKQAAGTPQRMFDGVECDTVGRPVRFWVRTQDEYGKRQFAPVQARDFVFLSRIKRTNQVRGETCLAQIFPYLEQLDGYVDAVVVAARMAAVFGLIFKDSPAKYAAGPTVMNSQGQQQMVVTLENGQIKLVGKEGSVQQVDAKQPMNQTPDFIRMMLRLIGLPVDMPLELTLMDFSQTNYASARGSLLQFYRAMGARQEFFKRVYLSRVFRWWIAREINAGTFSTPAPEDYLSHDWIAHGWQWVDPVKELQAALLEADMGVNSLTNIAASQGRDFMDTLAERAAEMAAIRTAQLPAAFSTMTRAEQPNAATQTPQQIEANYADAPAN